LIQVYLLIKGLNILNKLNIGAKISFIKATLGKKRSLLFIFLENDSKKELFYQ
jgi:hypothetical protein